MAKDNPPHIASETWITDITAEHLRNSTAAGGAHQVYVINVLPARSCEEAGIDDDEPATAPAQKGAQKDAGKGEKKTRKPAAPPVQTWMMKGNTVFDPVNSFRQREANGTTWGSLIDLAPRVQMSVARLLVRERRPKSLPTEGVIAMEHYTIALALEWTENYFTTVQVPVGLTESKRPQHICKVHGVLLDGGSALKCISNRLASQLGLERKAAQKAIINTDGTERTVTEAVVFPFMNGST
jgi:hypothetical protein